MAGMAAQKKIKFEVEFSIEMDEIDETHICNCESAGGVEELKRLQKALLENKAALMDQMMAVAISRLQEYLDTLAGQNTLASLEETARSLNSYDQDFFLETPYEFADLTRPLRCSALSARVEHGSFQEQVEGEIGDQAWQTVWSDLFYESDLGKGIRSFHLPRPFHPEQSSANRGGHYLLARHLTRHPDGVHIEALCTCGKPFQATGGSDEEALQSVWAAFRQHYEATHLGQTMQRGWNEVQKKKWGEC